MKRPQGFDPPTRRQAAPPPRAEKRVEKPKQAAPRPAPAKKPGPATTPTVSEQQKPVTRQVRPPEKRQRPVVQRPDREALTELRRAARERRRYERSEVKRFTRRSRNRRIGLLTAGGVVVLLVAMLLIAVYSPILALRTVTVEGTSRVDAKAVQAAVADQIGTPLARLDFGKITHELGAFPLIRSYVTETVPPNTLVIRVTEREPIAVVENGAQWNLVDPAGVVIQTVAEKPDALPVLSAGAAKGRAFIAASKVLLELPSTIRSRVGAISATTEDDVTFTFSSNGQQVIWGSSERGAQKARTLAALMTSQKKNAKVNFNVSSPDLALVIDQKP